MSDQMTEKILELIDKFGIPLLMLHIGASAIALIFFVVIFIIVIMKIKR